MTSITHKLRNTPAIDDFGRSPHSDTISAPGYRLRFLLAVLQLFV